MMLRKLLIAALFTLPAPAVPQTVQPLEPVPLVMCPQGNDGFSAGSAFRVGPHILISVNHVTSIQHCEIDGEPIHVSWVSPKSDFSMLSDDRAGKWLKVDCGGFQKGRFYVAVGHVRGADSLTAVPMVGTGQSDDGMSVLIGIFTAQPGQSGGPIIDVLTHEVVGTVNAANWEDGTTFSIPLKDTPVCGGKLA